MENWFITWWEILWPIENIQIRIVDENNESKINQNK